MRVEFRITSGARAGHAESFDKSLITIGRHPSNDLKFDVDKDTDVSSKHAEIHIAGNVVTLVDLNSTNGTFVNGQQIAGQRTIGGGDVLGFGESGPRVEVSGIPKAGPARRDTTARIAEAVEKQTGSMRKMIGGLAVLVVAGVAIAFWFGNRGAADAQKQVAALMHQNDSIARMLEQTVGQLAGKSAGVDSALQTAKRESDALRSRLQAAASNGDAATVALLSSDLAASAARRRGLMGAAQVDWEAVNARNAPGMVFIVVQAEDGTNSSGTGFNVSSSGLIVTNRHVVRDANGRPAKMVVVKFEGTAAEVKFKTVRVVKVSETDELAWLKLDGGGPYPTIQGIARNPQMRVGAPMALIGYPLGTGTAGMGGDINSLKPVSTLTVGTTSKVLGDTLQLDVYAAQGSSGSPVFNADGLVIGVLFGSPTESNGRIIYAVPSSKLVAQMPPEGTAVVR
jgi:S1-C subfamily serine protease